MRPIKTPITDTQYRGQEPTTGDLWCHRVQPGQVLVVYELEDADLEMLRAGGKVVLWIYGEPIPPVAVEVRNEEWTEKVGDNPFKIIPELEDLERQGSF